MKKKFSGDGWLILHFSYGLICYHFYFLLQFLQNPSCLFVIARCIRTYYFKVSIVYFIQSGVCGVVVRFCHELDLRALCVL
jgi:hypothetical protein